MHRKKARLFPFTKIIVFLSAPALALAVDSVSAARIVAEAHAKGNFDGVVVISEGGKIVFNQSVGVAPQTVFRLASLTKQVTSLLIMQEVTAGHITLDQKAGDGLPNVSIRQLLQHISGLPNPSEGPDDVIPAYYLRTEASAADITANAKGYCSGTPKRAPGGNFEYNNCDYIVLGAVLEQVTGKKYAQLVKDRIIAPLHLDSWGMWPVDATKAPKVALVPNEPAQNPATYGSAGGLYGNALDVAKWDEALLNYKLLSPDATATMFQADPKLYGEALGSWSYDAPGITPPLHVVERQGDMGSTRLLNLLLPDIKASIVIIANTERADLFDTYSRKGLGYALLGTFGGKNSAAPVH